MSTYVYVSTCMHCGTRFTYIYTYTPLQTGENSGRMVHGLVSDGPSLDISFSLRVEPDLSYTLYFRGTVVDSHKCAILANVPSCITSGKIMYMFISERHNIITVIED